MYKVLIIDDEKDICFLISEILKDENYLTYSALNSNEAISYFNKYNPDLVILDVWLSNSKLDLEILQKILNSSVMDYYITRTSVQIGGGYPCFQKNFIEKFNIPEFDKKELIFLKKENNQEKINSFLEKKYSIKI